MKKKTKFSLGMKIVTLLTVITMASVGFAAWVITAPAVAEAKAGSIKVDTVRNESVELTWSFAKKGVSGLEDTNEDQIIVYGVPEGYSPADPWLIHDDPTNFKENLEVYLHIVVKNNSTTRNSDVALQFGACLSTNKDADKTADFVTAITGKLIGAPKFTVVNVDGSVTAKTKDFNVLDAEEKFNIGTVSKKASAGATSETSHFYVKVEFKWGEEVGINAFKFYNDQEYEKTLADEAEVYLNSLYEALKDLSYKITISA